MKDKHELNLRILGTKAEYDKAFEKIRQIPENTPPLEVVKIIRELISLTLMPIRPLAYDAIKNFTFYRVRPVNKSAPINDTDIREFYFPPKDLCKMGRANRDKEQVFYLSGDSNTPFHEIASHMNIDGCIIYLTKWGIKKTGVPIYMHSFFFGIPEGEDNYASIMASGLEDLLQKLSAKLPEKAKENLGYCQKLYQELFTSKDRRYYHITSAIVSDIFSSKEQFDIPVVAYPSVAKNKEAVNFAFRSDFVEQYFYLKEVDKVIVNHINDDQVSFSQLSRGIVNGSSIDWKNLKLTLNKVHYENALVSLDKSPVHFKELNTNERLTSCCINHSYEVKALFERSNFGESTILKGISEMPQEGFEFTLSKTIDTEIIAPTTGSVYLNTNISETGRVTFIKVPITYTMEYV